MIRVLSPGLLTTVQDLGRPGYAHCGVSASGAADALSLRAGNLLAGNPPDAAALEMTLSGGAFEFESSALVALAGADFDGSHPMWEPVAIKAGETLRCGAARSGARCYLCVRGGIAVPRVMGSASTHLFSGIGGHQGRALRRGDLLPLGRDAMRRPRPGARRPFAWTTTLRATAGLQAGAVSGRFYGTAYDVTENSDRMGVRLRGQPLEAPGGAMLTEGVPLGAVQAPPSGQPIILFVEHQTTGGYPKIANVISADFTRVGQLRPRDRVEFEPVSFEAAVQLLLEQEAWLDALA
jgi:antagonist of KipI